MKSTIAYPLSLLILGMVTCLTIQANAQTDYDVTVGSGTGAGSLPYVIAEAAQSGNNDSVINIEVPTVSMTSQQFISVANLDIEGNGATINMNNDDRAFFVAGGDVSISNLSIEGGLALGGNGGSSGGGGAGLGGAIFVADGQSISGSGVINPTAVTLSGVNFLNNSAVGGNGASVVPYDNGGPAFAGGGGGGMGGNGGIGYQENPGLFANNYISSGGGGGGFGVGANGGNATYENAPNGNNGAFVGGAAGGGGVGDNGDTGINTVTTSGGANGGGGGGSQADGDYAIDNFNNGGGGGVAGGTAGSSASAYAGNGGFGGGGGGGGIVGRGGAGGFGGGGGGNDGAGGFGGGGGGGEAGSAAGTGGFGGGSGAVLVTGSPFVLGGGGLGAGGALYIMNGASLTIQDATFTSNSVAAGMGYNNGSAYGSDLFLGANVTFNLSNNITVNNLGGAGNNSDPNVNNDPNAQGGVIKTGAATLTLTGPSNYYSGVTTINQGTLALADSALEQGTSQVIVGQNSGDVATLALGSGSSFTAFSGTNPGIILGQQSGAVGTMTIGSGAGSSGAFLGVNQISGGTGGGQLIFNQNFAAGSSSNTTYVFATALTGNLQVVQNGLGTTLLIPSLSYGANSFNGGIIVNNGLLQLGTNTALPSGNDISVNGGAFDFNGYAPNFIGALTLNGGVLTNSAGSESVGASSITSISGIIGVSLSGNESFVQQGGGTTALTTNCTYGGDTIIHSGTLAVGKNASINGTSQVFVGYSGGDQGTLILGSGSDLGVAGFFETNDLPVILGNAYGSSGTIQIGTGAGSSGAYVSARYFLGGVKGSVIFDQAFDPEGTSSIYPFFTTLQGNLSVTQNGPGTTLLNPLYGSNSYTNSTTVNGGTLLASTGGSLGCSTNIIVNSGGILNLGASNVVSGNQQFSLNGGKVLLSANQSQNFGSWNILGNSLFDLGGTTSTLTFSAFAINGTLAIWNWNAGLETLDIPGAANALYPSVLFYSDSGTTEIGTGEILNGQLQAVPEPSSCTLIALGVLTLGIACRRRVS